MSHVLNGSWGYEAQAVNSLLAIIVLVVGSIFLEYGVFFLFFERKFAMRGCMYIMVANFVSGLFGLVVLLAMGVW